MRRRNTNVAGNFFLKNAVAMLGGEAQERDRSGQASAMLSAHNTSSRSIEESPLIEATQPPPLFAITAVRDPKPTSRPALRMYCTRPLDVPRPHTFKKEDKRG